MILADAEMLDTGARKNGDGETPPPSSAPGDPGDGQ